MRINDIIMLSVLQLYRRKIRTTLMVISVSVAVFAVVLIATIGEYGSTAVSEQISSLGIDGISIYISEKSTENELSMQYASDIVKAIPEITSAVGINAISGTYKTDRLTGNAVFMATDSSFSDVINLDVLEGRLFSQNQVDSCVPVAVVDETFANNIFGRTNIIGQTVRFNVDGIEQYFEICAVVSSQTDILTSFVSTSMPYIIYIPHTTTYTQVADQIIVQCMAQVDRNYASGKVISYLEKKQGLENSISASDIGKTLENAKMATETVTLLFLAVAGISFFVAMLGVLSGMINATHEKKAEIGLFIALGAKPFDIVRLFLSQSVILSIFGGSLGLISCVISSLFLGYWFGIDISVNFGILFFVILFTALCGILAGIIPAVKSSLLDPINAMNSY